MSRRSRLPDDPRPWTVLSSEYLHRKPWLTVRQERVRLPTGVEIAEYWVHEFPPWVNVVAVTREEQAVLIRQYRHAIGEVHFELPAGVTNPEDVSPEDSARRELLEETGYGGGRWSPLLSIAANPALHDNFTHCFLAEDVELVTGPRPDHTEDLRVHLVPVDRLLDLIDTGDVVQALNVAPLSRYLLRRAGVGPSSKAP